MAASSSQQLSLKKSDREIDRISSLPDDVLAHILSFIPTCFAFRTSILSTRWKNQWASVPKLSFHIPPSDISESRTVASSMDFVDRVFLFHSLPSIQSLSIRCSNNVDSSRLNAWISVAVKRGVQEIDIALQQGFHSQLTRDLFTCKTLVVLKLCNIELVAPASINFPCLKSFWVDLIRPSSDLTENLFRFFPVLEKLHIKATMRGGERKFNIYSPVLQSLCLILHGVERSEHVVMVDAPILELLTVRTHCLVRYFLESAPPLLKADISILANDTQPFGDVETNNLLGLVGKISLVKELRLMAEVFNVSDHKSWPIFPNLVNLYLVVYRDYDFNNLPALLHSMPNLVKLVLFKMSLMDNFQPEAESKWTRPQTVPSCLQFRLKEIFIWRINGLQSELELMSYLLENAKKCVKMIITADATKNETMNLLKKLPLFGGAQKSVIGNNCVIKFDFR